MVRDALQVPVTVALFKGRANYVCHHHLGRASSEGRFASREDARHLQVISRFAANEQDRRQGGMPSVPDNAGVWPWVTSTRDNCLGCECRITRNASSWRRAASAGGRHGGGEPPSVLRRRDAARRGRGRTAARLQHRDLRRGAPVAGDGEPVLRRERVDRAADRACARHALEGVRARHDFAPLARRAAARKGGARSASRVREAGGAAVSLPGRGDTTSVSARADRLRREAGRVVATLLESQAERSEGFENCLRARAELAARIERWRTAGREETTCAGSRSSKFPAAERDAARHRGDVQAAARRASARLDLHLGHALGARRFPPLSPARWGSRRRDGVLGQPVRLSQRRRCCTCPRACPSRTARATRRRWWRRRCR